MAYLLARMLEFCVLGSGSGGNATLVRCGETILMIDAGFSAMRIRQKLAMVGLGIQDLAGILITHEHGDHIKGIHQLSKKHTLKVYGTRHTTRVVKEKAPDALYVVAEKQSSFRIGEIVVTAFPVSHDAVDPVAYRFETETSSLAYISDTGVVDKEMEEFLHGLDSLILESNYDPDMLQQTPKRPWPLKQRIASRWGHLSNEQANEVVKSIGHAKLNHLVLAHLSGESNTPDLALSMMQDTLTFLGLSDTVLMCAKQDEPLPWVSVIR